MQIFEIMLEVSNSGRYSLSWDEVIESGGKMTTNQNAVESSCMDYILNEFAQVLSNADSVSVGKLMKQLRAERKEVNGNSNAATK